MPTPLVTNVIAWAAACAGACVACGAAQAQSQTQPSSSERPWHVGASQDFTHVSNVLLRTRGNEVSDTISTTTLLGGVNTRLGRQRLYADALLNTIKHRAVDERDSDGYRLALGMDWSTIDRISGTLRLGGQQRQTAFGSGGITQVRLSNEEKTSEFDATLRVGGEALLVFEAGLGWRKVDFSDPDFAATEYSQRRGRLGLAWQPSGLLTVRGGAQGSLTEYAAADAKNNGAFIGAVWMPTGISTVSADLAYNREGATAVSNGFRGVTGAINWQWQPTGRMTTSTVLSRAIGRDAGFLRLGESATVTANNFSQVTNRLSLNTSYELTGKVSLSGGVDFSQRNYGAILTGGGKDRETGVSLGARWAALRTVTVGCDIGYTDRDNTSAANSDAKNTSVGCNVDLRLD